MVPSEEYIIYQLKNIQLTDVKTLILFTMLAEILYLNKETDDNSIIIKHFGRGESRNYALLDKKYASVFLGFFDHKTGHFLNNIKNNWKTIDIIMV